MTRPAIDHWLDTLGYTAQRAALHRSDATVGPEHPYAVELWDMLRAEGDIRAQAVFDVEGVPTVVFLDRAGKQPLTDIDLDRIRQRLWNQNLVSVVLVVDDEKLAPYPVIRRARPAEPLLLQRAKSGGEFSAAEVVSSEIQRRLPAWFKPDRRVDQRLLKNLGEVVKELRRHRMGLSTAQMLIGQVLFISYLEHRGIVSDIYRQNRNVKSLHELVREKDATGIARLVGKLRNDFNGDFLAPDEVNGDPWQKVTKPGFVVLRDFLEQVDLDTGQQNFWNYDFSKIPVELLSGIYESFLGEEKGKLAAYYTPRHLATLTVDQALADSADILKEVVFDGACGSGILLTTFFRRLLGAAEARKKKQLGLRERIQLLKDHVFGSDLSEAAVRVTAFSLYLSLLERLEPPDISALQEREDIKLPNLRNANLYYGNEKGDFFSSRNPHLKSKQFTLLLSNPPWREPKGKEATSADVWATKAGIPRMLRQVAGDFAHRALDYIAPGGRICLIMPVSQFLSPSSEDIFQHWMTRAKILRLINFGDFQGLLFSSASHSCMIAVATPRPEGAKTIPVDEVFEYWVPKADVSLMLGRLSLQSGDRHRMQAQSVFDNPSCLVTLMWGNEADLSLLSRLRLKGTFGQLTDGSKSRWRTRKGVHFEDNNAGPPISAKPFHGKPYITTKTLKAATPALGVHQLEKFPSDIKTLARVSDQLRAVFDGPRILFPDGFDKEREIRASYYDKPAIFNSSIGVIAGPKEDADLLRFAAVFMRSNLSRYFLVMTAYQVLCERNSARLVNLEKFPFFPPERHENPQEARRILARVAKITDAVAQAPELDQQRHYDAQREKLDELVYDYFGLNDRERVLVREAAAVFLPSIRPRAHKSLYTPMQYRATAATVESYVARLSDELLNWRDRMAGKGNIRVNAVAMDPARSGPVGVVRVEVTSRPPRTTPSVIEDDRKVEQLLEQLRAYQLSEFPLTEDFHFIPDVFIWTDSSLYLVRPLVRRHWLERTAMRDARRIVEAIQRETHTERQAAG